MFVMSVLFHFSFFKVGRSAVVKLVEHISTIVLVNI